MAMPALSVSEQLKQLDDARKLVLGDANYYPRIIQGILPIIGPSARVELRRWGADFLAETFSSPLLPPNQKETLSLTILESLKSMIENNSEDPAVVKSVVQTAASIYPYVFRWMYVSPSVPGLDHLCTYGYNDMIVEPPMNHIHHLLCLQSVLFGPI
jgi:symplekin